MDGSTVFAVLSIFCDDTFTSNDLDIHRSQSLDSIYSVPRSSGFRRNPSGSGAEKPPRLPRRAEQPPAHGGA
jgi:hypothetical protein